MKPEAVEKIKIGVWGVIGGAAITMLIGFNLGGWSTSSSAKKMNAEAVLASQPAICVAQFTKQPNGQDKLKEFQKIESYQRSEFIEKGGLENCQDKKKPAPVYPMLVLRGLKLLAKYRSSESARTSTTLRGNTFRHIASIIGGVK